MINRKASESENVYLDGELEGSVELVEGNLTVGPDGRIRANVQARSIVVHGRVDGNLYGIKRVELKKSAVVVGDIYSPRIVIEDGASLKGSVLVQKCSHEFLNAGATPVLPPPHPVGPVRRAPALP